jgi:hypothetical protein
VIKALPCQTIRCIGDGRRALDVGSVRRVTADTT